jgi:hypothetical protein
MVVGVVLCDTNVYVKSMRVVVVLHLRRACILESNSSTCMSNELMELGMVLCDADVYIISIRVALQGNELMVVDMAFPISSSLDVLVLINWMPLFSSLRSTCM